MRHTGLFALLALSLAGCATHSGTGVGRGSAAGWDVLALEFPGEGSTDEGGRVVARAAPVGEAREKQERETGRRAREEEAARVRELVLEAWREGRGTKGEEEAREEEAGRARKHVLGVAGGVEEVGKELAFTFWGERGALTLLEYREGGGSQGVGRPVGGEELSRVLRLVFTEYMGRRTGEVVLTLRREETRWGVDYETTRRVARPPEARMLPVRGGGGGATTFHALNEAAREWLSTVGVPPGGEARVEYAVHLEDGRVMDWELLALQRTYGGRGGSLRSLSSEVKEAVTRVLWPFTEGVGARTVRLVLRAEHRMGEAEARGGVEWARVERPEPAPELSWYRAMHEATLLRWREDVHEGSAWLARKGVEEMALWYVGGIIARGTGFFATEGLGLVTRALGRGPEAAAGWLRTTLKRVPSRDRSEFERLWSKVQLEGEKALTRGERTALRGLMERIEQLIQQPLSRDDKFAIRDAARRYFKNLHPEFAKFVDAESRWYPVHHRRPLEHAHVFPGEDINAAENLVLLRVKVHERINSLWTKLRNGRGRLTDREVDDVVRIIDKHFADRWYNRVDVLNNEPELLVEAEEAALKELRRLFPGLK